MGWKGRRNTKRDNQNSLRYHTIDDKYKRRAHSIFREILKDYSNDSSLILDLGCGGGVIGRLRGSAKNTIGIEYDKTLAKIAESNCEKVYRLNLNNFTCHKIKERNFDIIFFAGILEHLLYPKNTTTEITKLLKPNGLVVISLPNIAQIQFRIKLLFGNFDRTDVGVMCDEHYHLYTYKTALKLISESNLKMIKFYPSGTIVSFLPILPKLLSAELIFLCQKNNVVTKTSRFLWFPIYNFFHSLPLLLKGIFSRRKNLLDKELTLLLLDSSECLITKKT